MSWPIDRSRSLLTAVEVLAAARWRLERWAPERVTVGIGRIGELVAAGVPLDTSQPAVAALLAGIADDTDRRDPWPALAALAVLWADQVGHASMFWRAGFEVVTAYRVGQHRKGCGSAGDALDDLIARYLLALPEITPRALWDQFALEVEDGHGAADVISEFDDDGRLVFDADGTGLLADVTFDAFRRRVQRVRKNLPEVRQQPETVAPRRVG